MIASIDFDDALYLGSENDGVYFDAAEDERQPGNWYASAVVDCNSAHFTQPLLTDLGPYKTQAEAMQAGLNIAYEWLVTNNVKGWRKDYARFNRRYKA